MGFHNMHFYSPTLTALSRRMHFYMFDLIDPYIRGFRQVVYHSDHRHFVDPRHVSDAAHLWAVFVAKSGFYGRLLPPLPGSLRPPSAAFTGLPNTSGFPPEQAGVSGGAFQGVTPSFHSLDYQFTELI